jgi:hypothetical protein
MIKQIENGKFVVEMGGVVISQEFASQKEAERFLSYTIRMDRLDNA